MSIEENKAVVDAFWKTLYERDWDAVREFFTDDSQYTDMCTPADEVAVGQDEILARMRLGLEKLSGYENHHRLTVAEGDAVVTEHAETWEWDTGESVTFPFTSVQELRDGKIVRWFDYWDLQTLMNAAPAWWVEHISQGYK